jgi:hypothetical protein
MKKNITGKEMFGAAAGYTRNQADLDGDGTPDYVQNNPIYKESGDE